MTPVEVAELDQRTIDLLRATSPRSVLLGCQRDVRPTYDAPGRLSWRERVCAATDCWETIRLPPRHPNKRFCSAACRDRDRVRRWRRGRVVSRLAARRAAILGVVLSRRTEAA